MKRFEVTIWNTVNMSRDIDKDEPEVEQHIFYADGKNEEEALKKAKEMHWYKTKKGVWESEICDS